MPVIHTLGVSKRSIDSHLSLEWALDSPVATQLFDGDELEVRGWIVAGSERITIELQRDGQLCSTIPVDERRDDLAKRFPAQRHAGLSGFRTSVRIARWQPVNLTLVANLPASPGIPLADVQVRRTWREVAQPSDAPLVSMVVALADPSNDLDGTVESLLSQSYPDYEVILVGDWRDRRGDNFTGPSGCVRRIDDIEPDAAAAWNLGLRRTSGDHLMFLVSGERLAPDALASRLQTFERCPESSLVMGTGGPALLRRSVLDDIAGFAAGVDPRGDLYARIKAQFPVHP